MTIFTHGSLLCGNYKLTKNKSSVLELLFYRTTMIPNYEFERFFLKENKLLVTNNDYLMTIDLGKGTIVKQEDLYE